MTTTTRTANPNDGGHSSLPLGTTVGARYELKSVLGAGGMSAVYIAQDTLIDRLVALKILDARADPTHAERFRREVVVGQEGHPNLVTTYDAGVWEGRFFIAMELVQGRTLREAIVSDGPFPQPKIDRLVEDLLSGLAHLHERGITHRDVKSRNVMITEDETAKLADFGLARIPEDHTVTASQESVGTPAYMAPEQILGERVEAPADLYALGILLFEAVAGVRPFVADSQSAVLHQHLKTSPDVTLLKTASPRLRNLILRLLEKKPVRRYTDAGTCLAAWRRGRIRKPLPRRLLALGAVSPISWPSSTVRPGTSRLWSNCFRRNRRLVLSPSSSIPASSSGPNSPTPITTGKTSGTSRP